MNNIGEIADFTSGFWSGWITLIAVSGILFIAALIWTSARGGVRAEEEVWDDTLREGDAAPPAWWYFLFISLVIISCIYLVLYPGLGSWRGALNWTQFGQYADALEYYEERFGERNRRWKESSFAELATDDEAMRTAAQLFADNCSSCHGRDGRGQANLFPDLTDDIWQWGASAEEIHDSIAKGRNALMLPQTAAVGGAENAQALAGYVLARAGLAEESETHESAAAQFQQTCAACHGADGKGNPALGAPDLTDEDWLYGNTPAAVLHSITQGRQGEMPAQEKRMGPLRSRLMAAWLASGKIKDFPPR
ncbi:MAG: c-type cytochrome [Gammaproteobacteria bacterium]